jgi:hypothetical protein
MLSEAASRGMIERFVIVNDATITGVALRVPGAMQRIALAKRCFAEPGPYQTPAFHNGPGSAAHDAAKCGALRCVRGTRAA